MSVTFEADSRDPAARLKAIQAVIPEVKVLRLETGDYRLTSNDHVEAWEVKTVGSLLASVVNARANGQSGLDSELSALVTTYPYCRLVVIGPTWSDAEGKLATTGHTFGWSYAAYIRILDSVADHGVGLLQIAHEDAFVQWVKNRVEAFGRSPRPKAIAPRPLFSYSKEAAAPLRVFCSLPGINQVLAARIWHTYGSVEAAFQINPLKWAEDVKGIGLHTAEAIIAVIDAKAPQQDVQDLFG